MTSRKRKCPTHWQGKKREASEVQTKYALIDPKAQPCPMAHPVCSWCGFIKEAIQKDGRRRVFRKLTGETLRRVQHGNG